jgi:hypothetical protein
MAFCTNCGATVAGSFCQQCGKPAAGGTPPAGATLPPAPSYAPAPPVVRRTSPLVWILVAVLGLFVLGGLAVVGTGLFFVHKAKQAGLDPEQFRDNPALAMTKLLTTINPELEVINVDEGRGVIRVRNKKDGKEITLNFEDVKHGRIKLEDNSEGKTASMEFGADSAKAPSWIPTYPGSNPQGTFSLNSGEGGGGAFNFTTADAPAKVLEFYQNQLKQAGFKITITASAGEGSMLIAQEEGGQRSVTVTAGKSSDGTSVNILFGSKK